MELESVPGLQLHLWAEELKKVCEMHLQYVEYYVLEEMIDMATKSSR
jgi:hypothetical protein